MRARPENLVAAARWARKAENDFRSAAQLSRIRADCPTDNVCFHVQQCVEKYLKALLVAHGIDFPKTHSIDIILALVPPAVRPRIAPRDQLRLTAYATVTRYPGPLEEPSSSETTRALRLMRRIRTAVRRRLPKGSLPTRRCRAKTSRRAK